MTSASSDTIHLNQYRQQFPALANKSYFNYGGQGPMPQASLIAIQRAHEYIQHAGPFCGEVNTWVAQEADQTRQVIALEIGVAPETITLTENVTVGCNIALWGIEWKAGDHILLSDCEHPGVIAAVQEIQRRFGVEISTCPLMATLNAGDPVDVVAQHLRATTRLVVVSHILWNTGQVLPLRDIVHACRAHPTRSKPVQVLVDAAQSVGVLPLNLAELGADFYAFTGHKWLCGPAGTGGLYVRPDALDELNPTFIGWRGVTRNEAGFPTGWKPDGQRFEVATSDFSLYGGLRAAIATHYDWGSRDDRYQRIRALSEYLWAGLNHTPGITCLRTAPPEAGLVSFQLDGGNNSAHQHLVRSLESQHVMLRTILDPFCIRACVHYFTTESEIDQLLSVLRRLQDS
ncbi:MAG: aminotransferase class V-fold PLP-dependent enzyme [Elainellaceae cyanobacterium]